MIDFAVSMKINSSLKIFKISCLRVNIGVKTNIECHASKTATNS